MPAPARVRWRPLLRCAVTAGALVLAPSVVAYQDVAALAAVDHPGKDRWLAHLAPAPIVGAGDASLDSFDGRMQVLGAVAAGIGFVLSEDIPERAGHAARKGDRLELPQVVEMSLAGETPRLRGTIDDGATPPMIEPASATPADTVPFVTAALPVFKLAPGSRDGVTLAVRGGAPTPGREWLRLTHHAVLAEADMPRAKKCLAEAIYFESRSEPERGQYAVAQVVMNRVRSEHYPDDVCSVVYQNRHWRNRCQFSFACDGTPQRITDRESWAVAQRIANDVLAQGAYMPELIHSTHYHATYVRPYWLRDMFQGKRVGNHIFYVVRAWANVERDENEQS